MFSKKYLAENWKAVLLSAVVCIFVGSFAVSMGGCTAMEGLGKDISGAAKGMREMGED